jgi:hypothetical protein
MWMAAAKEPRRPATLCEELSKAHFGRYAQTQSRSSELYNYNVLPDNIDHEDNIFEKRYFVFVIKVK